MSKMYHQRLLIFCALFLVVIVNVGKTQVLFVEDADIDKKKINLAVCRQLYRPRRLITSRPSQAASYTICVIISLFPVPTGS